MPVGPYKTFGECVMAQKQKGRDDISSRRICGQMEKNTQEATRQASSNVKYEDDNGHLYIKAFLLDASVNVNQWGINPSSLDRQINTFIGKPLVLTEDFHHPMPPEMQRVGGSGGEDYDDDNDPYNTVNVDDIVEHWLAFQESYRIGNIIDITEKKGTYFAIIEITDPAAKDAFRNNDVPLFVSPAIAQLDPHEDATNISNWTGIHLAIVSDPAYTIKKALVTSQCHGDSEKCLLQLRQAAVQRQELPRIGCGFCRTKALARYAEIVKSWRTRHSVYITKDVDDFTNSSFGFSKANSKLELTNDTNQNNQQNTTTDTNKPQDFEKKQQQQGGDLGEQTQKGQEVTKTETKTTTTSEKEEVNKTAEEVGLKVAGMQECIQIFQQNGVDPQQAGQICKLAAQALMENQNQPNQPPAGGGQPQNAPKTPGQFGSVADYEKELARYEMKIAQLSEELKNYKKGDKTDAQRIAELEETVTTLSKNLKEKELEAYLVTKIADEDLRSKKIKRFAELNMTIDDLRDIYENVNSQKAVNGTAKPKTAEVVQQQLSPISKVKLQVASTNDNSTTETAPDTKLTNEIRERNNKILSSLLQKGGIY